MRPESFAEISVPVSLVVGDQDDQAVPEKNAKLIALQLKDVSLNLLPKVTHYTFLSECTDMGMQYAKQFCTDPEGVNRSDVHEQVGAQALVFFRRTLYSKN
jgi:predicted dienelactone hydrolase